MKNFDIENLERRNIYQVPDDFFAKMQENVLKETVETTPIVPLQPTVKKKNWWYAAAAAVTVLLGSAFFFNQGNAGNNVAANDNSTVKSENSAAKSIADADVTVTKDAAENYDTFVSDLTSVEKGNQTVTKPEPLAKNDVKPSVASKKTVSPEVPVEQILEGLSEEDLIILANNTEQDVYLDLYN